LIRHAIDDIRRIRTIERPQNRLLRSAKAAIRLTPVNFIDSSAKETNVRTAKRWHRRHDTC
jgi:hypothetical protein